IGGNLHVLVGGAEGGDGDTALHRLRRAEAHVPSVAPRRSATDGGVVWDGLDGLEVGRVYLSRVGPTLEEQLPAVFVEVRDGLRDGRCRAPASWSRTSRERPTLGGV